MYVVRVISSCKEAMTINCFSLVLSSLFCPLFVTLFTTGFAFPYLSCCSVLQLSFYPHLLRHQHTKMGSCRGLAACDTPAALGWLTLLAEQVPSDSSHSWLQLGLLAGALSPVRGEVLLPQDSFSHLFLLSLTLDHSSQ